MEKEATRWKHPGPEPKGQQGNEFEHRATGDEDSWLDRMLHSLDDDDQESATDTRVAVASTTDPGLNGVSSGETTYNDARRPLSHRDLLFTNLSGISGLAKKSNFCTLEASEECWANYKELIYKHYRKVVDVSNKRAESSQRPAKRSQA